MSASKGVRKQVAAKQANPRLYSMNEITQALNLPATEVGVKVAGSETGLSSLARRVVGEVFSQKQMLPTGAHLGA